MIKARRRQTVLPHIFLVSYFLFSGLVLFMIGVLTSVDTARSNWVIVVLFLSTMCWSLLSLFKTVLSTGYSLVMMHWVFCFVFLGLSGMIQYLTGRFVYGINVSDETMTVSLLIIVIWMFSYSLGCFIGRNKMKPSKAFRKVMFTPLAIHPASVWFFTMVSVSIAIFVVSSGGIESIFSRATGSLAFARDSVSETLLLHTVMRNAVLYGFAISLVIMKHLNRGKTLVVLQFLCLLIVNPVFGMARYNVAIVYIGLMLIFFPSFKMNRRFLVVFFVGIILLFPMINNFRRFGLGDIPLTVVLQNTIDDLAATLTSGDHDAFSMIVNTLRYVEDHGITYGRQLVGAMFFFLPRSVWPSKPLGSGHTVRLVQGEAHLNVSSPLIAEGLINFGLLGVVVFGLLFGKTTASIDRIYWHQPNAQGTTCYIQLLYPFLLSMFFFMNRGDLMSTFSFTISHILVFSVLFALNNRVIKRVLCKVS